jgi:alpha-beta hydrolase superfamily lysophospholipase
MGATLCLTCLLRKTISPDMAIFASPWLKLVRPPGFFKNLMVKIFNIVYPNMLLNTGVKKEDFSLTSTPQIVVEKDPLMHKLMSVHYFFEIEQLCKSIINNMLPTKMPILLMHGNEDRIASPVPTAFLAREELNNVQYKEWEKAPHQLHAYDQTAEVTKFTIEWINKYI